MDMGASVRAIGSLREWIQATLVSHFLRQEQHSGRSDRAVRVRGFRPLQLRGPASWRASLNFGRAALRSLAISRPRSLAKPVR